MKIKQLLLPIVFLLFGLAITILGMLFKILHWPLGSEILTIGMLIKVFAILFLAYKLFLHTKQEK